MAVQSGEERVLMVDVAEVTDAPLRESLTQAESSLDDGEYTASVRYCVTAYARLIDLRPDMLIAPPFARGPVPSGGGGGLGGVGQGAPRPWPSDHGVRLVLDEREPPSLTFTKDRFTLSEAATYFEYTLDMVLRAQRRPPPEASSQTA
jgi:hypothetical protein